MKFFASVIGMLLLSGIVSAQYQGAFVPGYPSEPIRGYYQPVMVRTPEGTSLACVTAGQFSERLASPLQVGLLVGCDYRLRITGIPFHPGKELFPTLTLLARTYPPQGRENDFPIVITLTLEDLELALAGQYITRVIYLENPNGALPVQTSGEEQLSHDIRGGDPVAVASSQGLPVAIVRIGGRVPPQNNGILSPEFAFGSPPWVLNRTIPPENIVPPVPENTQLNTMVVDPELRSEGQSVLERRMTQQPNAWQPPHRTDVPGGRSSEYLVGGSDAGMPVSVAQDWTVRNFGTGETVAHFDTLDGRVIVQPSNRIHIYAPRFGAIRKVEGLLNEGQVTALVATRSQLTSSQNNTAIQTGFTEQEAKVRQTRIQDQLNSIEGQRRSADMGASNALIGYDNFQVVDSDSMVLLQRTFGFGGKVKAQLDRGAMNARAWQGSEGLKVQINELAPMIASNIEGAASLFQVRDEQSRVSQLRLIKVASKESALPGEIVEFTLRFDNVGNQLIGNVTILDDLLGRLEFLPGTAVSSLAAGFVPQLNSSGSLTLRFEITDPLAAGDFGVIQFQCRVR
jgi:uncharacterized repeat protein (TIGR01451 family)